MTSSTHSIRSDAPRWMTVHDAAAILGLSTAALRKAIERRARRVADGGTEAQLDGVRARKLGRQWRVLIGPSWGLDPPSAVVVEPSRRGNDSDGQKDQGHG